LNIVDILDETFSDDDREAFEKSLLGRRAGFGKRPAVIVVDMTNEFTDPSYPFASGELCLKAADRIHDLLKEARVNGVQVIYTKASTRDITPSVHAISRKTSTGLPSEKKKEANEIVEKIAPMPGDIVIEKDKASAFFGTQLSSILVSLGTDTLIVMGATTSGCVRATVVDGASYGYFVSVPIECCGDKSVLSHKVSLVDMHMKYADVLSVGTIIEYLRAVSNASSTR
jgi:maleamate amidohydrolase